MPETAQTSAEIEARIRSTRERIDELSERERTVNQDIGRGIANGGEVGALRDERREVRDEIEDLTAALPHLERQLEEARQAARVDNLSTEMAALDGRVSEGGDVLRECLSKLREAVDLYAEYEQAEERWTLDTRRLHNLHNKAGLSFHAAGTILSATLPAGTQRIMRGHVIPALRDVHKSMGESEFQV